MFQPLPMWSASFTPSKCHLGKNYSCKLLYKTQAVVLYKLLLTIHIRVSKMFVSSIVFRSLKSPLQRELSFIPNLQCIDYRHQNVPKCQRSSNRLPPLKETKHLLRVFPWILNRQRGKVKVFIQSISPFLHLTLVLVVQLGESLTSTDSSPGSW